MYTGVDAVLQNVLDERQARAARSGSSIQSLSGFRQ